MMPSKDNDAISFTSDLGGTYPMSFLSPQYVGLGFDICWYMFTGGSISSVYSNALLGPTDPGGQCVRTRLKERLEEWLKERLQIDPLVWKKAGESGSSSSYCAVWNAESQADTLAWASDVPPTHELPKRWQRTGDLARKLIMNSGMTTCLYPEEPTPALSSLAAIFLYISTVLAAISVLYPYVGKYISSTLR